MRSLFFSACFLALALSAAGASAQTSADGPVWVLDRITLDPPEQRWSQINSRQTQGADVNFGPTGMVLREYRKRSPNRPEYESDWSFRYQIAPLPERLEAGRRVELGVQGVAQGFPAEAGLLAELAVLATGVTLEGDTTLVLNTTNQLSGSISPAFVAPETGTFFSISTFIVNRPSVVTHVYRRADRVATARPPRVELSWSPRHPLEGDELVFSGRARQADEPPPSIHLDLRPRRPL
jgi:hypothetical protein